MRSISESSILIAFILVAGVSLGSIAFMLFGPRGGSTPSSPRAAKPAAVVRVGDRVEATVGHRRRVLEVVKVIDKRVGAPVAAECLVEHTPPDLRPLEATGGVPVRDPGAGRPTKRDRRQLDRHRGR